MKKDIFLTSADQKVDIGVSIYQPEKPKATVQFLHGMSGHRDRYEILHRFLVDHDYAVIASDIRGHGDSINKVYPKGHMDSWQSVVADQLLVWQYMDDLYPDLPHYSISHSFGSMTMRVFLQEHDDLFEKMIFTGAPHYIEGVENVSGFMDTVVTRSNDEYFVPEIGTRLVHRAIERNPEFYPNEKTKVAFNTDEKVVRKYTMRGLQVIIDMLIEMSKDDKYQVKNPQLEILSMSGTKDGLAGDITRVKEAMGHFRDHGYKQVTIALYADMVHEILFEIHPHNIVYRDILRFLEE